MVLDGLDGVMADNTNEKPEIDAPEGPAGGGHPLSGKTLIFVIDLLGVA